MHPRRDVSFSQGFCALLFPEILLIVVQACAHASAPVPGSRVSAYASRRAADRPIGALGSSNRSRSAFGLNGFQAIANASGRPATRRARGSAVTVPARASPAPSAWRPGGRCRRPTSDNGSFQLALRAGAEPLGERLGRHQTGVSVDQHE